EISALVWWARGLTGGRLFFRVVVTERARAAPSARPCARREEARSAEGGRTTYASPAKRDGAIARAVSDPPEQSNAIAAVARQVQSGPVFVTRPGIATCMPHAIARNFKTLGRVFESPDLGQPSPPGRQAKRHLVSLAARMIAPL